MLEHTFLHLRGIGKKTERALWKEGVRTWADLATFRRSQMSLFPERRSKPLLEELEASELALENGDSDFFADRLPKSEHYRIALTFPSETVFLDIETTGLSHYYDEITMVGAVVGSEFLFDLQGTKDTAALDALREAKCIVTFNGSIFDLKFLAKNITGLGHTKAHVDLRFFSKRFGYSGGQKSIEKEIGIRRPDELEGVTGETAPILWHEYRHGNLKAAKTLIEYNFADIEGMRGMLDHLINEIRLSDEQISEFIGQFAFSNKSIIGWSRSESGQKTNNFFVPKFSGKFGSLVTFEELHSEEAPIENLRVVGIDLTGSEKRATGWAFLEGHDVETTLISTDHELISKSLETSPDLISIDSPLSMPRGRIRVTDDDPGRDKFGIMRQCERELKRRGVNVYPSLLPSMQRLTARGIALAQRFRELGVPVIESYPGAAQDIMGIPRKQQGLMYLKKGLADFGVIGPYLTRDVSHDEVDAITSAVVGLFFWTGKFEAMGVPEEEFLIIPDLKTEVESWTRKSIIGISGSIASGKTTAARILEAKGWQYVRFSEVLADLLVQEGRDVNRENLQEIGYRINSEKGQRWLGRALLEKIEGEKKIVVDGLRFPEDHAFLVEEFGPAFRHVHIEAKYEIRTDRYQIDSNASDFRTAIEHPLEQHSAAMQKLADFTLSNDDSISEFTDSVLIYISGAGINYSSELGYAGNGGRRGPVRV